MGRGRPKKPIAVHLAEGNPSHLTKEEIAERLEQELDVPFTDVRPPEYLTTKKQIEEFNHYAKMLLDLGIFSELDVDLLAKYIISKGMYLEYTKQLEKVMKKANIVHKWGVVDKLAGICDAPDGTKEDFVKLLESILRRQRGDDATVLMNLQDKAFKQCLACAKELGLSVTSRLKLVVPTPADGEEDDL